MHSKQPVSLTELLMCSKKFKVKPNKNNKYWALASIGASGDDWDGRKIPSIKYQLYISFGVILMMIKYDKI